MIAGEVGNGVTTFKNVTIKSSSWNAGAPTYGLGLLGSGTGKLSVDAASKKGSVEVLLSLRMHGEKKKKRNCLHSLPSQSPICAHIACRSTWGAHNENLFGGVVTAGGH